VVKLSDRRQFFFAAGILALAGISTQAQPFRRVATYNGLGAVVASSVGPGPTAASERFYLSYLYVENTIDVVGVDPATGAYQVYPNPAASESGARAMVLGSDGNLYLGTLPSAHFYKLDPKAGKLTDLGRPSPTEQYIWDVTVGADKKIYGVTYPQARLVRCDPATGQLEDLGRLDPIEQYARHIAASPDGFLYVAIGTTKCNIAVYEIRTGKHKEILPEALQLPGVPALYRAASGRIFAEIAHNFYELKGWKYVPVAKDQVEPPAPTNLLRDGSQVEVAGRTLKVTSQGRTVTRSYNYPGNRLDLFRIAFGPDNRLYASSVLPIDLARLNAAGNAFELLGGFGGGEFYSFLAKDRWLLGAAYSAFSPLSKFDVDRPFNQEKEPKNPALVNWPGSDASWRPQALIEGPDGRIYAGAISGYGKLGGPLVVWDTKTDQVREHAHVVWNQSVNSLGVWRRLVVGGTNVGGGGGSRPTEKLPKLFLWDTLRDAKVFELAVEGGGGSITDVIGASNGLVYFISGRHLFAFDPTRRVLKDRQPLPFRRTIYNAIAESNGALWGLSSEGIFRVDLKTNQVTLEARPEKPISGGFAMKNGNIYFISGPEVWSWQMPAR
jgi:streptogramin lyase